MWRDMARYDMVRQWLYNFHFSRFTIFRTCAALFWVVAYLGGAETVLDFWGQQGARFFATHQGRWTWRLIVHKDTNAASTSRRWEGTSTSGSHFSHLSWLPLALIPCCSRRQQIHLVFPRRKKKLLSLLERAHFGPTSVCCEQCSAAAPFSEEHLKVTHPSNHQGELPLGCTHHTHHTHHLNEVPARESWNSGRRHG